jgi:hypothetical protein
MAELSHAGKLSYIEDLNTCQSDTCFIRGYRYSPFNTDSFGTYNLKLKLKSAFGDGSQFDSP